MSAPTNILGRHARGKPTPSETMTYRNLLEPEALVRAFLVHPPENTHAFIAPGGAPAFSTHFDVLTTAESRLRRAIAALPCYRHWSRALKPLTCFVGTTVSEYTLFPSEFVPADFVQGLRNRLVRDYSFVIIKDIPQTSPLLESDANDRARQVVEACQAAGFVLLEGQALAYVPIDFDSVDEFVFKLSRGRRRDIRRKLRSRAKLEVAIAPCGSNQFRTREVLDEYYRLYLNVYRQSEIHFDLLRAEFFQSVLQNGSCGGIVFEYRQHGRLIGYNLCFVCGTMLIDKYVGFRYPEARDANLYFVSWFHNLAFARERGLKYYVAGWTDPEIKAYLGAQFTFTCHAVYVRNGVLRAGLRRLASHFERDRAWRENYSVASSSRS